MADKFDADSISTLARRAETLHRQSSQMRDEAATLCAQVRGLMAKIEVPATAPRLSRKTATIVAFPTARQAGRLPTQIAA